MLYINASSCVLFGLPELDGINEKKLIIKLSHIEKKMQRVSILISVSGKILVLISLLP